MIIERTKSEIVIRVSSKVNTYGLQRLVDYLKYQELTATSKAKQSDVDAFSKEMSIRNGGIKINIDLFPSENCGRYQYCL